MFGGMYLARKVEMEQLAPEMSSYKETKIGNTLYQVTRVYTGEKELKDTLSQLAVHKVLNEIQHRHFLNTL